MELTIDTRKLRRRIRKTTAKLRNRASAKTQRLAEAVVTSKVAPTVALVAIVGLTIAVPIGAIVNANFDQIPSFGGGQLNGFNLTTTEPPKDNLASANNQKALSQMQGADILTLQTFQTSPFKAGTVRNSQSFEALERDLSIKSNYPLFQKAALEVLNATGFCKPGPPANSGGYGANQSGGYGSNGSYGGSGEDGSYGDSGGDGAYGGDGSYGGAGESYTPSGQSTNTSGRPVTNSPQEGEPIRSYKNGEGVVSTEYQRPDGSITQVDEITHPDGSKSYEQTDGCFRDSGGGCTGSPKSSTSKPEFKAPKKDQQSSVSMKTRILALFSTRLAYASSIEDRLRDCANTKPDEFAAVSNMIRSYFEWQGTELRTVMMYYNNKIISPILRDRVEGRLVSECLRQQLVSKDTAGAMNVCRNPENWPVSKTFYAACSNGSKNQQSNGFQYKQYVSDCILSNIVKDSVGSGLVYELLPNFSITVSKTGIVTETSPITATPATAYHMIYEQVYSQISSEWFASLITQGCLPSVFAPKEFGQMVIDKDPLVSNYYSICMPQKLIQRVNALPKIDAEFFLSIIAKRIAAIQVAELLNGAVLITEETHRNLMAADREIGTLVETYPRYMAHVAQMYLDQLNLVNSKKLDDVLERIEAMFERYEKEISSLNAGNERYATEIVRQRRQAIWND